MTAGRVARLETGDSRRARRKIELQERILRAALGLFERQGFFGTTVEQVTEAADVGKGTFFNYFPSKEHVLAGFGDMQLAKVRAAVVEAENEEQPARDVLERLIYALAQEPGRSQALVRSLLVANLSSESVRKLLRGKLARGQRLLARIIAHGQRRGEIDAERTPASLARAFQQTFIGTLLLWAVFPPSNLKDSLAPAFAVFWSGVCAVPKATEPDQRGGRKTKSWPGVVAARGGSENNPRG
jgi:AcrR family transcriptional regulator